MRGRLRVNRALGLGVGAAVVTLLGVTAGLDNLTATERVSLLGLSAVCAGAVAIAEAAGRRREYGQKTRSSQPGVPRLAVHSSLFHLPRDINDFTGREAELTRAVEFLSRPREQEAVPVVVIAGKGGIGKTSFAIHVAQGLRDRFPDGQLFIDLRGADAAPLDVRDVLAGLLRELGVARPAVPEWLEERSRLYRARMSGWRVLVVLDDATDEMQVRPLLPGGPGCAVLVTRRVPLVGLADALQLNLEELDEGQATDLLEKVVGNERVKREPESAAEVLRLCGYLPLAVRIVGNKLASRRYWTLSMFAERLRDERRRLAELSAGDLEVRATIALSYNGLNPSQQRLFRLLGMLDVQDFSAWVAAAMLDCDLTTAETLVDQLVDMQLLVAVPSAPAATTSRYGFHTLLQVFARERLEEEKPEELRLALHRMIEAYVAITERAYALAETNDVDHATRPPCRWITPDQRDIDSFIGNVTAWFAAERANLIAVTELGYREGFCVEVCRLAISLYGSFNVGAHWHAWQELYSQALEAARQCEDPRFEAEILLRLGDVYKNSGRVDGPGGIPEPDREDLVAADWLEQSRTAFRRISDRRAEVAVTRRLGGVYRDLGYLDRAERCYQEALALAGSLPHSEILRAYVLRGYGCLQRISGRYTEAVDSFQQALMIFETAGDQRGKLGTLRGLGETYAKQERWTEAEDCLRAHLAVDRALGDRHAEAHMLFGLGEIRRGQQRYREAIGLYEKALPMFHELEHRSSEAETLEMLGAALLALGKRKRAREAWERSRRLYRLLLLAPHADRVSDRYAQARRVSLAHLAFRRAFR